MQTAPRYQHVVRPAAPSTPEALVTPARIAGAASRLRMAHTRANGRVAHVFGHGAVACVFARAVDDLASATNVSATAYAGPVVCRVVFDLANVPRLAERLHSVAVWMHATVQAIEAEDATAAALAVDLAQIIETCELIGAATQSCDRSQNASGGADQLAAA